MEYSSGDEGSITIELIFSFREFKRKLILRDKFDYMFIRLNAKHKYVSKLDFENFHL